MQKTRESLMYELAEYLRRLGRVKWFLGDLDLDLEGFMILDLVSESGSCSMKDIVSGFSLAASTATGIVDRLVKEDYVRRKQSTKDRRMVIVEMTPKGLEAHDTFRSTALERMDESLSQLSEDEIMDLIDLVKKLIDRLA